MTRFGAMLLRDTAPEDLAAHARIAAPGLDELWIVEDLNWPGGIAQLAMVLAATDDDASGRPAIGHGIAPAPFRPPAVLAMEWATLARAHPGRVIGGIGHGVPDWMDQLGLAVDSPMTLLRETIDAVRDVLDGRTDEHRGRYVHQRDVRLVFPPTDSVPILTGVTGPRGLALSGEIADGTLIPEGFDPEQIVDMVGHIETGRARAGRTEPHHVSAFVGYFLGDPATLPPPPIEAPDGWAVVSPDVDEVVEELQRVVDAGVDSLIVVPFGPIEPQMDRFRSEAIPRLSSG